MWCYFIIKDVFTQGIGHYQYSFAPYPLIKNGKRDSKLSGGVWFLSVMQQEQGLREFWANYGVDYDKFMNWRCRQLWSEKQGKTVNVEQSKVTKVQIAGKSCNSPTAKKMEVKQPEGEPPIKWVKLQLILGATLFLRNTTVLDLSLKLGKMIGWYAWREC